MRKRPMAWRRWMKRKRRKLEQLTKRRVRKTFRVKHRGKNSGFRPIVHAEPGRPPDWA